MSDTQQQQQVKRCMGRVTKLGTRLHFGDEHHWFYLEYRCKNDIDDHQDKYGRPNYLCEQCSHKYDDCRTQYSSRFIHGLIGGPFGAKSRIYGSDWYNEAVKKYGKPCPEYMQAAVNAQRVVYDSLVKDGMHIYSNNEMPPPKKPVRVVRILKSAPNMETVDTVAPSPTPNSSRKRTPKVNVSKTSKKTSEETGGQKKKRKIVKKKVESDSDEDDEQDNMKSQTVKQEPVMSERFLSLTVSAIEVADAPKEICGIEYIIPEKREINGVVYYTMGIDEDATFVYVVDVDDKIGKYVGKLNDMLTAE